MRSGASGALTATGVLCCECPTRISSCSGESHAFCAVSSPVMLGSAGIGATTDMPRGSHMPAARALFGATTATTSAHRIAAQRHADARLAGLLKRERNRDDGISKRRGA